MEKISKGNDVKEKKEGGHRPFKIHLSEKITGEVNQTITKP